MVHAQVRLYERAMTITQGRDLGERPRSGEPTRARYPDATGYAERAGRFGLREFLEEIDAR